MQSITQKNAELGIIIRKKAMKKVYGWFGVDSIIHYAFNKLKLHNIYWCVNINNIRAIKFYNKHNFHKVLDVPNNILKRYKNNNQLVWYSVFRGDCININDTVVGCKIIHIKTISTINSGQLSFFESLHDIDFNIKRVYYITKVSEGIKRGFHAHKRLKQILFCPYGRIQIMLENKYGKSVIELSDPSIGILIDIPTWREILWLQKDSVLCVVASKYYDENDYIRSYEDFKNFIN